MIVLSFALIRCEGSFIDSSQEAVPDAPLVGHRPESPIYQDVSREAHLRFSCDVLNCSASAEPSQRLLIRCFIKKNSFGPGPHSRSPDTARTGKIGRTRTRPKVGAKSANRLLLNSKHFRIHMLLLKGDKKTRATLSHRI